VINGTNLLWKDNPRRPNGNATETMAFFLVTQPVPAAPRDKRWRGQKQHHIHVGLPRFLHLTRLLRPPGWLYVPGWLSGLTHHVGIRLFVKADAEAGWHRWRITELRGGLARRYRDPRFDALRSLHDVAEQMRARFESPCPGEQDGTPQ
jgi:hypothetical protein